jgi:cyclic di-GMP phosphodiesterase Gmr
MQSRFNFDLQTAATEGAHERAADGELGMLRDIFRLLPSGVTFRTSKATSCW